MTPPAPALPPALLALTPGDLAVDDRATRAGLVEKVRAGVDAGLRGVLVREPALFDLELLELAEALRSALGPDGWLGVHDRAHLVASGLFDGVQLGWRSLRPAAVRVALARAGAAPGAVAIGFSAHAGDAAELRAGADFLLLAPVHATASHPDPAAPDHRPPLGPEGFEAERTRDPRPTWALGGIGPAEAAALAGTGAHGVAVRGALLGRATPAAAADAARGLLEAWEGAAR